MTTGVSGQDSLAVPLDQPILSSVDDRLGRKKFASELSSLLAKRSESNSFVVALFGPWGSGKSSLKNMVLELLQKRGDAGPVPTGAQIRFCRGVAAIVFESKSKPVGASHPFPHCWLRYESRQPPIRIKRFRPPSASALAVKPPQRKVGAASCPAVAHSVRGCPLGASPSMAHDAGDSQFDSLGGETRHPIRLSGSMAQAP